jgi:hypothetical protein
MRFDKLQTTNPQIDEDYCMFVMLSYNHLYYLKDYAGVAVDYDWYSKKPQDRTPSVIYKSLSEIKLAFHDITKPTMVRGIPDERNVRKSFAKNPNAPVISKSKRNNNIEITIKAPFGKSIKFARTAFNANDLGQETLIAKISALHAKIVLNLDPNAIQLE